MGSQRLRAFLGPLQLQFEPLQLRDVSHVDEDARHAPVNDVRRVGGQTVPRALAVGQRDLAFEYLLFAGERRVYVGSVLLVQGTEQLLHRHADDLVRRPAEPLAVCSIRDHTDTVLIPVSDHCIKVIDQLEQETRIEPHGRHLSPSPDGSSTLVMAPRLMLH